MRTALQKVRDELGPDAVILKTCSVKPSGLFGFFRSKVIEVTAAADVPAAKKQAARATAPEVPVAASGNTTASPPRSVQQSFARLDYTVSDESDAAEARPAESAPASSGNSEAATATSPLGALQAKPQALSNLTITGEAEKNAFGLSDGGERFTKLEQEISLLKQSIDLLLEREAASPKVEVSDKQKPYCQPLLDAEVDAELAQHIAEVLLKSEPAAERTTGEEGDGEEVPANPKDRLVEELTNRVLTAEPLEAEMGERKVIVLVGPTGVGKTTTLAKIAARFIHEDRKIVFLTADTYRIAAVEQLQKYADIMGVEMEAAYTPAELSEALERHADADLVFVDTAGRSPHNKSQMEEMVAYVEACLPAEVHLVLSVNVKPRDLKDASKLFTRAPINRIIFTKLDESKTYGSILNIVDEFQLPISFVTTGQNVPEDIEPANGRQLAERIIYGRPLEAPVEEEGALS